MSPMPRFATTPWSRLRPGAPNTGARHGFTLIEMLVVVIIAGVLGAMSFGKIQKINNDRRLSSAISAVQNDIEAAFNLASRNRVPMRISWLASTQNLVVTNRAGTTTYRSTALDLVYGLRSSNVAFSHDTLEVFPNGMAADTLLITLSANGVTKKVWVSRAGMVQLRF